MGYPAARYERYDDVQRWDRGQFLRAVSRVAPEVLKDLKERISGRGADALAEQVRAWAKRYRIDVPWMIEAGHQTAEIMADQERWEAHIAQAERLKKLAAKAGYDYDYNSDWKFRHVVVIGYNMQELVEAVESSAELGIRFQYPRPDLTFLAFSTYISALREAFEEELERYLETLDAVYESAGYTTHRPKRETRHFEWFVRYQMLDKSQEDIASSPGDSASVTPQAVQNGCRDVSERIGIPLKPRPKRGPQKGRKRPE